MALALFDLDKTLIAGDSDFIWGEFLVEKGIVDKHTYQAKNKRFFDDYAKGELDMVAYLEFCLHPLTLFDLATLTALRDEFVTSCIRPLVYDDAFTTLDLHRKQGDVIVVISATNEFIIEGVSALFDIDHYMGTHAEQKDGLFTGKSTKTPCFKEGKITNLNEWLKATSYTLEGSYFYSDSHNDLPLLSLASTPIATNPDDILRTHALQHHWRIEDWK